MTEETSEDKVARLLRRRPFLEVVEWLTEMPGIELIEKDQRKPFVLQQMREMGWEWHEYMKAIGATNYE